MAANSRFAMATHIMTGLALNTEDVMSSGALASSVNTNPVVVRRILGDLTKAGLVETQAGKTGGARLAKDAKQITLYDIYAAVDDGSLFAFNPNDPNKTCNLSCLMKSILAPVFESAGNALADGLKKYRLAQIVEEARRQCSKK